MSYYRDWTKGMVHLGYAERLYRLPPGDPPQILKKEDTPTYNTLVVGWHTTDYPTIAATFASLGGFYDSSFGMWIFQESEHAPAPSNHPPPENDDDPKLRPIHRTFNVPKTVPIGTHDEILFFLGGLQRCDLPTYCRPMLLDIAATADGSAPAATSDTAAATTTSDESSTVVGIAGRRRKAARTETSTAPGASTTTPIHTYLYSMFSSNSPRIPCIESRVCKGAAKGLSADVLRELLTLRSATAVTGSKSSQASSLLHMGSRNAYHTFAYRKYVYSLVEKGEMQLVAENQSDSAGPALSVEAALVSLPWNAHGEIKTPTA